MSETPQQYTQRILDNAAGKDALRVQRGTAAQLKKLTKGLDKKQLRWRPAAGKWSIAEILAHLADTEIVAGWRLRLILGSNGTPIVAFDQDSWASVLQYGKSDPKWSIETLSPGTNAGVKTKPSVVVSETSGDRLGLPPNKPLY